MALRTDRSGMYWISGVALGICLATAGCGDGDDALPRATPTITGKPTATAIPSVPPLTPIGPPPRQSSFTPTEAATTTPSLTSTPDTPTPTPSVTRTVTGTPPTVTRSPTVTVTVTGTPPTVTSTPTVTGTPTVTATFTPTIFRP